jgi:acyl-CoA thioesterase I
MRPLLATLTVVLALGATLLSAAPRSVAQSPGVYIALGDSIAAGIGSSLPRERGYPALVHDLATRQSGGFVPFESLAVPGETAATFIAGGQLDRFRASVARAREGGLPLYAVSVSLGGNELLALDSSGIPDREAGLDQFRARYAEALNAIRAAIGPDTPLVVTTYYDLTEGDATLANTDAWWIEQFNTVIRETATTTSASVADVHGSFAGRIAELTLFPVDVHPSNAGHRVIADLVWQALGTDTTAPEIDAPDRIETSRDTPTLRFNATDSTSVRTLTLEATDVQWTQPLPVETGEYVALLDLSNLDGDTATVTIVASDPAGNVARRDVIITRAP